MRKIGLNRTSVGLKLEDLAREAAALALPQSNQRGIETRVRGSDRRWRRWASIEPAWD